MRYDWLINPRRAVYLCGLLLVSSLTYFAPLLGQEATEEVPTEHPVPTEVPTDPSLPPPSLTELLPVVTAGTPPNAETPPVPTEALTPETTAMPAPELTVVVTEPVGEGTAESATAEMTLDPLPPLTAEVTDLPTLPTATPTAFPTEPPLTLLFSDHFDSGALYLWTLGAGWSLTPSEGGQALTVSGSDAPLTFVHNTLIDAAAEARVQLDSGAVRLSLQASEVARYSVVLAADGAVTLYRGETALASGAVSATPPGGWRRLRLSVLAGVLRASVDGIDVLTAYDDAPLPPGTLTLESVGGNALTVDDVSVWQLSPETFSVVETATATPELGLIFSDNFEQIELRNWSIEAGWAWDRDARQGVMRSYDNGSATPRHVESYQDVVIETDFRIYHGSFRLSAQDSAAGRYDVYIQPMGEVALYRNGTLLQNALSQTMADGSWHHLKLSVMQGNLRLWVDEVQLIDLVEASPLPAGSVKLVNPSGKGNFVIVDNFQIWTPTAEGVTLVEEAVHAPLVPEADSAMMPDSAALSPIGNFSGQIAFMSYHEEETLPAPYVLNLEVGGSTPQRIHTGDARPDHMSDLRISPNGEWLIYEALPNDSSDDFELYLVSTSPGAAAVRLTDNTVEDIEPAWSPDSAKVIFRRFVGGGYKLGILDIATQQVTFPSYLNDAIASSAALFAAQPAYSPDGAQIVFEGSGSTLYRIDTASGANLQTLAQCASLGYPNWSPTGQNILFEGRCDSTSGYRIWLIPAAGGAAPQRVTDITGTDSNAFWSPDGLDFIYQNNQPGVAGDTGIWIKTLTSAPVQVDYPRFQFMPSWSQVAQNTPAYNIVIESTGSSVCGPNTPTNASCDRWSPFEVDEISAGVAEIASAIYQTNGLLNPPASTLEEAFNRVFVDGDAAGHILFLRLDTQVQTLSTHSYTYNGTSYTVNIPSIQRGVCFAADASNQTNQPAAVFCNGPLLDRYDDTPVGYVFTGELNQYTAVHELGHLFDYRSARGPGAPFSNNPLANDIIHGMSYVVGGTLANGSDNRSLDIRDCTNRDAVMGWFNNDWVRGRRGWGTGPEADAQGDKFITDFQQNPESTPAKDNGEVLEAAADMFLNWVYRRSQGNPVQDYCLVTPTPTPQHWQGDGFRNERWTTSGQVGVPPAAGTPDPSLPGDARYFNFHDRVMLTLFQANGW